MKSEQTVAHRADPAADSSSQRPAFDIVAVASSAGGLNALTHVHYSTTDLNRNGQRGVTLLMDEEKK